MRWFQKIWLVLLLLGSLMACKTATQGGENQEENDESTAIELKCVPIEGAVEEDIYRYAVHLVDGSQSTPVMLIPVCDLMDSTSYASHQVPTEAIAAASSWWAGRGDYIYAIPNNEGILLRRAVVDEMQLVRDYGYTDWALWQQDTLIRYDAGSMMPITGLYAGGGHDESYLLLLDKIGEEWHAEAVELSGMLPPMEDVRMEIEDMKLKEITGFNLDTATGRFSAGEWGEGELTVEDGINVLLFKDKEGPFGGPLRLALEIR